MPSEFYILLLGSAVSRALDQMIALGRQYQSWLPAIAFKWKIWGRIDAWHTYMFCTLWLPVVAVWKYGAGVSTLELLIIGAVYYQIFNLFFHTLFLKPYWMRLPFFATLIEDLFNGGKPIYPFR